jgi:4-amino-4-deoxy-L-arabinose transferase-like glycosyltransferase
LILALLPPIVLVILFLVISGWAGYEDGGRFELSTAFLAAVILCGTALVVITEGLSLISGITRLGLALAWSTVLFAILLWNRRTGALSIGWDRLQTAVKQIRGFEWVILGGIVCIVIALFIVALVSPPNNVDSLLYHMPRVVHWAQNQSLEHFPAPHIGQNVRPYWAEAAILHLRVLWGNDTPANLVQWFSMVTSIIAASGIAALLGGKRKSRWLSALFVLSIPMGILQATTTQNDYVSAMWVVILGYFVVLSKKRKLINFELFLLGSALGLGMLTKGTFFPYAAALMIWFFLPQLWRMPIRETFKDGLIILLVVVGLNSGFWVRNINTFGGPYGRADFLQGTLKLRITDSEKLNDDFETISSEDMNKGAVAVKRSNNPTQPSITNDRFPITTQKDYQGYFQGVIDWISRIARIVAMNFVTPSSQINNVVFRSLRSMPRLFDENFVRDLEWAAWNHEDTAGSPLHMLFVPFSIMLLIVGRKKLKTTELSAYAAVALGGFLLLSLINTSVEIFSIRYQLPFFVLWAPVFGVSISVIRNTRVYLLTSIGLLIYCVPYLLYNNMRPIIGHPPWPTRVESVFVADEEEILFAIVPHLQHDYSLMAERIKKSGCDSVGLNIRRSDLEYLYWWLLDAPQSDIRIENLASLLELEIYRDQSFTPCAIICVGCQGVKDFHQLPIAIEAGNAQLFLESD